MYRIRAVRWRITYFGRVKYRVIGTHYFTSPADVEDMACRIEAFGLNYILDKV